MRFADKVAVVTGAANGIGKAIALRLAEEGASIVSNDNSFLAAEELSEKIKDKGGKAIPVKADVTQADEVEQMFEKTIAKFGKVDILVSNAGVKRDAPIHTMTEDQWDDVINVQLKGCFNCTKSAQAHMVPRQYGKILILASPVPPGFGRPGQMNYSAANAGLIGLATSLAIELGPYNINVNCIAPDFIQTQMTRDSVRHEGMFMDDYKKVALVNIPLRRLGTVDDVSQVAAFLASDESSYVTGQVIKVCGGP
jgi:3-oxoacyl-[acyl-carrier protein] reductase